MGASQDAVLERRGTIPRHYFVLLLVCGSVFISYIDRTTISVGAIAMRAQFGWSETQKGWVLSAFYVGYILLMLVSGALTNRFGGRRVLGTALVCWSLFTVLTPAAAWVSLPLLLAVRVALGCGESAVFPASMSIVGEFVPAALRSRAAAAVSSSLHLGTLFALPVTGWMVQHFGWSLPFYVFGIVGLLWAVALFTWFDDRGGRHRSSRERAAIPWSRLLKLPAVWAIIVGHLCSNWPLYLMSAWLPSYFARTFSVNLVNAGLLAAAASLSSFLMSNAAGIAADRMLVAGVRASVVRKLMQTVGLLGGAGFLLLLTGASSAREGLVLACAAAGLYAFTAAGYASNSLDIAPQHAGVIWGLSNTFATLPGIFGVALTGWLVDRTGSFATPFLLTAGVSLFGALVFIVFASGDRQLD
jgi:MFS transporter, ACS family, solute carrier family 17 (sodium-dependent inorganic phosphate cotransporter), other